MDQLASLALVSLALSNFATGYFFWKSVREIRWSKETEITKLPPAELFVEEPDEDEPAKEIPVPLYRQ